MTPPTRNTTTAERETPTHRPMGREMSASPSLWVGISNSGAVVAVVVWVAEEVSPSTMVVVVVSPSTVSVGKGLVTVGSVWVVGRVVVVVGRTTGAVVPLVFATSCTSEPSSGRNTRMLST